MKTPRAGILGLGAYVPSIVRKNDWWPESVTSVWKRRALHLIERLEKIPVAHKPGMEAALEAMNLHRDDPFNGAVERRVMRDDEKSSDMEIAAAREALRDADVDPSEIDGVISFTLVPDHLCGPTGAVVHLALGLPKRCFTLSVEGACNSFAMQMALADQAIRSGAMKKILVITSVAFSRLVVREASLSAWCGDAATAVVVGEVPSERGILSFTHGTEGEGHNAMVFGIPGKRWYEEGRVICYSENRDMAQGMILGSVDRCKEVIDEALAKVGLTAKDVAFYAGHQGGPWLRRVTQQFAGMSNASFVDTYKSFGNLGAANIPMILSIAKREKLLKDGDLVASFSAGTGQTYSAMVLRWADA